MDEVKKMVSVLLFILGAVVVLPLLYLLLSEYRYRRAKRRYVKDMGRYVKDKLEKKSIARTIFEWADENKEGQ